MELTIRDARRATTDSHGGPLPLSSNVLRLKTRLLRETGSAISDYKMIEDGDRILCAVSGGMDSFAMLTLLLELQKRAPIRFEVIAVNVDQKQPGFPEHVLPAHFESLGVAHRIVQQDTYSVVTSKIPAGKTMCGLCSRLRRGILYRVADEIKATKIALGHHMDDIVETLFLNMFFGGQLKAMPPKLLNDAGKHIVIRPLAYCEKRDIGKFARAMKYPIIPCNLCGSQENLQRVAIRKLLAEWNVLDPRRKRNIFRAIQNVRPSHLGDLSIFNFVNLKAQGMNLPSSVTNPGLHPLL
jgi:tRNA 2-thiocytidine biosynthesis protein TtcA